MVACAEQVCKTRAKSVGEGDVVAGDEGDGEDRRVRGTLGAKSGRNIWRRGLRG